MLSMEQIYESRKKRAQFWPYLLRIMWLERKYTIQLSLTSYIHLLLFVLSYVALILLIVSSVELLLPKCRFFLA